MNPIYSCISMPGFVNPANNLTTIIASLPKVENDFMYLNEDCAQFVHCSKNEVEEKGGICLAQLPDPYGTDFIGIALSNKNAFSTETPKWVLNICPGGGNMEFSKKQIAHLMPEAIKKLHELNIHPVAFVIDGRHPGDTLENFESWQKLNR